MLKFIEQKCCANLKRNYLPVYRAVTSLYKVTSRFRACLKIDSIPKQQTFFRHTALWILHGPTEGPCRIWMPAKGRLVWQKHSLLSGISSIIKQALGLLTNQFLKWRWAYAHHQSEKGRRPGFVCFHKIFCFCPKKFHHNTGWRSFFVNI